MALCSKCRFRFATLEDEFDQHECPRCGFGVPEEFPPGDEDDGEEHADENAR